MRQSDYSPYEPTNRPDWFPYAEANGLTDPKKVAMLKVAMRAAKRRKAGQQAPAPTLQRDTRT